MKHQTSAHADLAVDAPDRQFNAGCLCRLSPCQYMLIHAVYQCSIKVEEKRDDMGFGVSGHKDQRSNLASIVMVVFKSREMGQPVLAA